MLGLTPEEAEQAIAPYGEADIVLWPGFATTIPTFEQRVVVIVNEATDATGSPDGGQGGEPLPSG